MFLFNYLCQSFTPPRRDVILWRLYNPQQIPHTNPPIRISLIPPTKNPYSFCVYSRTFFYNPLRTIGIA